MKVAKSYFVNHKHSALCGTKSKLAKRVNGAGSNFSSAGALLVTKLLPNVSVGRKYESDGRLNLLVLRW